MFSHVCWHRRPGEVQHSFTSAGGWQAEGGWPVGRAEGTWEPAPSTRK